MARNSSNFFVGIGAAKAGTTWLAGYLRGHPQVFVSPLKELHYFDELHLPELVGDVSARFLNQAKRLAARLDSADDRPRLLRLQHLLKRLEMRHRPQAYTEYFRQFVSPRKHRAFGEITPAYAMLGEAGFEDVLSRYPRARFLFIMRNPVDRYWSHLRFARKLQEDFNPVAELERRVHDPQFTRRTQYENTLRALDGAVPANQQFITFYENLFGADGDAELRRLCSFLDIDYVPGDFDDNPNKGFHHEFPEASRRAIAEFFAPTYRYVIERYPDTVPARWHRDVAAG